jgi:predicted alpha/beta superfamily hydrolase
VPRKLQTPVTQSRQRSRRAQGGIRAKEKNNITGMATEPIFHDPSAAMAQAFAAASDLKSRLFKHKQFESALVDDKHDFIVYVPPTYALEPERKFPVLFMQDGQNLFDPETSFMKGNYWRLGETADALILRGEIEPLVMVGIYNTGEHRINEYTPVRDRRMGGGDADEYGRMLVEELLPCVAREYRLLGTGANCGVGGSSLGGLVSMHLGLRYPEVFGKLAIMSPSVWWHGRAILKTVKRLRRYTGQRIWLDVGTKEGQRALPDVRLLKEALEQKGWREGVNLGYMEAEGAEHTESAWAERVAPMLSFLFPT